VWVRGSNFVSGNHLQVFGEVYDDLQADFRFHEVNRKMGLLSPGREIKSISFREVDRAANTTLSVVL